MLFTFAVSVRIATFYSKVAAVWNLRFFRKLFHALAIDLGLTSKDVEYLSARSKQEGLSFLTKTLPALGKAVDRSLANESLEIPSGFKVMSKRKIPHFLGALFLKVFNPSGVLRPDACPLAVRAIRQVCFLFYKVNLPHGWADEKRVARGFVDTDNDVSRSRANTLLRHPSRCTEWERDVLLVATNIVTNLTAGFQHPDRPHASGGSVVEKYNPLDKYNEPKRSLKPWSSLGRYITPFRSQYDDVQLYPSRQHFDLFSGRWNPSDHSEVLFVPKDSRGPRLICREPSDYQMLQQGLKDYLRRTIERHPLTFGQINFTEQGINQIMSRLGSITREWSTLDLKDASDRNSLALVKILWSGNPKILEYLLASRTSYTTVHGKILELAKFAPMGSALCFPVMATNIYALLCGSYVTEKFGTLQDAVNCIYVYGDDIIVPTAFADAAIFVLEWFGFRVNKDKCFVNSRFTESCGTDWFQGTLVTPVRLRSQCLPTPTNIVSNTETANLFAKANMWKTAEVLYTWTESLLGSLPYGSDLSSYLSRWCPPERVEVNNYHLPVGKRELRAWTIVPERKSAQENYYTRLHRTLPLVGKGCDGPGLPGLGEYVVPKRFSLRKRKVRIS